MPIEKTKEKKKVKCDETYYYTSDLNRVIGWIFIGYEISFEGYTILIFKKNNKIVCVFDY